MKKTLLVLVALLCVCVYALPAMAATSPLDDPSVLPETNESGFLPEGESPYVYKNHGEGYWYYLDQTVRIEIMRTQEGSPTMTYYIADIYCNEGTSLYTVTYNEENPGRTNALPQDIADAARAVYAQSGDFYSYRIANDRYPGNIVRNGKVLYEQSYSKMIEAVPNLATMAFYPSGRAEVTRPGKSAPRSMWTWAPPQWWPLAPSWYAMEKFKMWIRTPTTIRSPAAASAW